MYMRSVGGQPVSLSSDPWLLSLAGTQNPAGGGLVWINGVPVDSHYTYSISVGASGQGSSEAGGDSSFSLSDAWRVVAYGGAPGSHHVGGQGGGFAAEGPHAFQLLSKGGGLGGRGGDASWKNETVDDVAGGGGGAGGYEGGCCRWWLPAGMSHPCGSDRWSESFPCQLITCVQWWEKRATIINTGRLLDVWSAVALALVLYIARVGCNIVGASWFA
jgi:hypothetical protein